MPMNIYSDTPNSGSISFAIHWDNTKFLEDGTTPDEAFVEWYTFPQKDVADTRTRVQYATACKAEAKLLAKLTRQAANKAARKSVALGTPEVDND